MTTATAQTQPVLVSNTHDLEGGGGDDLPRTVRGLALPFNDKGGKSGVLIDDDGVIHFFAYTLYEPGAFDGQIAQPNFGGRVRFMWNHGGSEGMAGWATGSGDGSRPIGNVTELVSIPAGVMFGAEFNDTEPAVETAKAVKAKSVQEVSVLVENLVAAIKTDDEGVEFLSVSQGRIWDVSLVTRAQYASTRIFSANCASCGPVKIERDPNDTRGSDGLGYSVRAVHDGHSNDATQHIVTITVNGKPAANAQTASPPNDPSGDGEPVALTREQVGGLYARIDTLQNILRREGICEACSPEGEPCEDHVRL